jgi:hypothetical protein
MSYIQAIMHRVEMMVMNKNPTDPDTLAPPELGSEGNLVMVPNGNVGKGSGTGGRIVIRATECLNFTHTFTQI